MGLEMTAQWMTGVIMEYAPGAASPRHHHTAEGSVVAYVLEGAIRSRGNDAPERIYRAGESWTPSRPALSMR